MGGRGQIAAVLITTVLLVGAPGAGPAGAATAGTGDWTQERGGPTHQNASLTDNTITSSNVARLRRAPMTDIKEGVGPFVVAGGVAYLTSPSKLIALDVATRRQRWSRSEPLLRSRIALSGRLLIVGSRPTVKAVDAGTGAVVWTSTVQPGVRPPAVGGGMVFVMADDGTDHGRVFALDAATGALKWTSADRFIVFGTSPAYADGKVFVGTAGEGDVRAYDAATGAPLWRTPVGDGLERPIVVADGTVYATGAGNRLHALDEATGAVRWNRTFGDRVETVPAIVGGSMYLSAQVAGSSSDGHPSYGLYAVDTATGAIRWQVIHDPTADRNAVDFSEPVVAAGLVYTESGGAIQARDAATGRERWTSTAAFDYRALAIAGGRLLAAIDDVDSGGHYHTGFVSFAL
jgi:outer membrane protein assembly factor BamB